MQRLRQFAVRDAAECGGTALGVVEANHASHCGAFARTIRAQEARDVPRRNGKTEIVYCCYASKFFREVLYVDHRLTLTSTMRQCRRSQKDLRRK